MTHFDDIYSSLQRSLGPAFAGELDLAEQYAAAVCLAAAQDQIDLAAAQNDPTTVTYLVDDLCKDFNVYPPVGSSLAQKRVLLAAAMSYSQGCSLATVRAGLQAILGSLYIHARPSHGAFAFTSPPSPSELMPVNTPHKLIEFNQIVWAGTRTVSYTRLVDDGNPIIAGEVLDVESGNHGLYEQVTVTGAGGTLENPTLTAFFTRTHEAGKNATTGPRSTWSGFARRWLIAVEDAALTNAPLLATANEFLRKTLPAVSEWVFCRAGSGDLFSLAVDSMVGFDIIGEQPVEA